MTSHSFVYIATQNPASMGLARAQLDLSTGRLSTPALALAARDPGHFVLSADGRHLYLCNAGTPGGVSAVAVNPQDGGLSFINHLESQGRGPSYISLDATGRFVLDANYGGGYVEVLALGGDGALQARTALVRHEGSSIHPQRQTKAYAHWFHTDPGNRFALAADLGMDRILVYRFDAAAGTLAAHGVPVVLRAGSGPRHLAFHPNGRWVYAVQELSNEVVAFRWDAQQGALSAFQTVATLDPGFTAANTAAEIAVRADGRFLYVSNRGEDSVVVYAIDAGSGELRVRQRVASGGRVPRYFAFDASQTWLIVTHQDSGDVVVFHVDALSGELRQQSSVNLPRAMGVVIAPR